jgi:hypothetical protein
MMGIAIAFQGNICHISGWGVTGKNSDGSTPSPFILQEVSGWSMVHDAVF